MLGLIHITIVFIHHDCIFPSTSNEMQEVLSICGSRDSLPLCLIEIWLDQSKHWPANTGAAARAYHFIRDNSHCMRNINYPNYPRFQPPNCMNMISANIYVLNTMWCNSKWINSIFVSTLSLWALADQRLFSRYVCRYKCKPMMHHASSEEYW